MAKKYSKEAAFYLVYIREAHPTDGWQVRANSLEEILFEQPTTLVERSDVAKHMCTELKLSLPCVIDKLDNEVGTAYSAWPDRMYVVGIDGKIVFKGEQGPQGFKPDQVADALDKYLPTIKRDP